MRALKFVLLVAGIAVLGALVYRVGAGPIVEALGRLAWWQFALICLPYALIAAVDTLGWRFAFADNRAPYGRLCGARLAGEALNLVTALGSAGGEVAKAWLIRRDVSYAESVPAVIIAKTTIVMAQVVFLVIGIAVAWMALPVDAALLSALLVLLGLEIVAVGGFVAVQVTGLVGRMGAVLARFGLVSAPGYATQLDRALRDYYRRDWRRLALSVGFHTLGWLLGALEAWATLWALEIDAGLLVATVVEALGAAVRSVSFLVPASLGALEGANTAAFRALGFGAAAGLAFSVVRRARQAVWIVIGLLVMAAMRWRDTRAPSSTVL